MSRDLWECCLSCWQAAALPLHEAVPPPPSCLGPSRRLSSLPAPCCYCCCRRLYRILQRLEGYLGCWLESGVAWTPPPGWRLVAMLNLTQTAPGGDVTPQALPFAAVLHSAERGQAVVALRGTMTAAEWLLDFSYK